MKLCFDIGGTNLKYAKIENGVILERGQQKTPKVNCRETVPAEIIGLVKKFGGREISGLGIASAGQIDCEKGRVIHATRNLPDYTGCELKQIVETETGLPCTVENDANAAALGEMRMGVAANDENFVMLTLGTGIGGAFVVNRQLFRGNAGIAGEVGHIVIEKNGRPCNCGGNGCLEQYASISALLRDYKEVSGRELNGYKIMRLIMEKDEQAMQVFSSYINSLAKGITTLIHFLDPGLVIIGGGFSREGKRLINPLRKRVREIAMPSISDHTRILSAELHNDAALIGVS